MAYSAQLQASEGVPSFKFKKVSGKLLKGLKLGRGGVGSVTGVPMARDAPGTYTIMVSAKDSHRHYPEISPTVSVTLTLLP